MGYLRPQKSRNSLDEILATPLVKTLAEGSERPHEAKRLCETRKTLQSTTRKMRYCWGMLTLQGLGNSLPPDERNALVSIFLFFFDIYVEWRKIGRWIPIKYLVCGTGHVMRTCYMQKMSRYLGRYSLLQLLWLSVRSGVFYRMCVYFATWVNETILFGNVIPVP